MAEFTRWPVPARTAAAVLRRSWCVALLAVALVRVTGVGASHVPDAATMEVREFRFADRQDGGIDVVDPRSGTAGRRRSHPAPTASCAARCAASRASASARASAAEPPFRLIGRADGRLTLEDPATGRRVDLESFGPTNAAVFAQLLALPGRRRDERPAAAHRRRARARSTSRIRRKRCTRTSNSTGLDVEPGDRVLIHDAPAGVRVRRALGRDARGNGPARAGCLARWWTRTRSWFELTELYEVSFSPAPLDARASGRKP